MVRVLFPILLALHRGGGIGTKFILDLIEACKVERKQIRLRIEKLKTYFRENLAQEISGFDAEFLIDFFAQEVGEYFCNRGLYDAPALIANKKEELSDSIMNWKSRPDVETLALIATSHRQSTIWLVSPMAGNSACVMHSSYTYRPNL